jgi:acyl carrier protein
MHADPVALEEVKAVLLETLGLEDRADSIAADTPLFGALPEFDSMAILELITVLERRFAITVDGDDVTAEAFDTLTNLTELVRSKRSE